MSKAKAGTKAALEERNKELESELHLAERAREDAQERADRERTAAKAASERAARAEAAAGSRDGLILELRRLLLVEIFQEIFDVESGDANEVMNAWLRKGHRV